LRTWQKHGLDLQLAVREVACAGGQTVPFQSRPSMKKMPLARRAVGAQNMARSGGHVTALAESRYGVHK